MYWGRNRRGSVRIKTENLPGELALDLESAVLQLSAGGMLVELPVPLPVGSEHPFTLNIDQEELEVRGVIRNCLPLLTGEEPPFYRLGIQFRGLDAQQQSLLQRFVEQKLNS